MEIKLIYFPCKKKANKAQAPMNTLNQHLRKYTFHLKLFP